MIRIDGLFYSILAASIFSSLTCIVFDWLGILPTPMPGPEDGWQVLTENQRPLELADFAIIAAVFVFWTAVVYTVDTIIEPRANG